MSRRRTSLPWARLFESSAKALTRNAAKAGRRAVTQALKLGAERMKPPPGAGDWIAGMAIGPLGARRYRLYRPPGVKFGERLPLLVMLHGCGQDAKSFATSTRMNRVAARGRFAVLYPEQDRLANAQGCWNWFDTKTGRANGEAALILHAIDQVCALYAVDRARVALAGLSAGASMAALLATRHPERFKAVVMHSGIPPGTANSTVSAVSAMRGHRLAKPLVAAAAATVTNWPPLLVIHGGLDPVVSVKNGRAAAQAWAAAAGAREGPWRTVQRGQRYAMTVTDFSGASGKVATLVEVPRLGHAWSGGAPRQAFSDTRGPDASRIAWTFVSGHFGA